MKKPLILISLHCLLLLFIPISFAFNPNQKNGAIVHMNEKNNLGPAKVQASIRQASKNSNKQFDKKEQYIASIAGLQSKGLSNMKLKMEGRVKQAQLRVNGSLNLSAKEKEFKLHVLEMFLEELRESERDMIDAEESLKKSLTLDFWNSSTLKENSWKRLEALRLATLKEEKSFKRMQDFEEKMRNYMDDTNSTSWMGELIKEVVHAADQLLDRVAEHEISEEEADPAHIEAVVHIREGIGDPHPERIVRDDADGNDGIHDDEGLDVLIDMQNNKYILTRLKDPFSPFIDHVMVMDIIMILLLSIPLGWLCHALSLPSLFGYILAGVILGPSGFNWIEEMIQMETLGELGVFMIMFCTGLEFSFERIRKVWRSAVQVPLYTTLLMILIGVIIGSVIEAPVSECAFVSACLSLSSTPLVTRFLQGSSKDSSASESSPILLGMLIVQDIQLSFIVALMPGLAGHKVGERHHVSDILFQASFITIKTLFSLCLVALVVSLLVRFAMPTYSRYLSQQTRELQLLGALMLMYVCQLLTNHLGVSMELGCFIAGAMISHSSHQPALEHKVQALRDFLSVIFFASIGFHVFPSFVILELTILVSLTILVVSGKFLICLFALRMVLPSQARKLKWIVSSGLAQVSEFAFVLGSRALHLRIITREVYLLILSVTTLSLILAPVLWKLSIWRYRVRHTSGHIS